MALKIPPLFLTLLFMLLAWLLAQLLPDVVMVVPLPFSLLLAMVGVVVCGAGVVKFRRLGTTMNPIDPTGSSLLVTTGIYQY